MSEEAPKLTIDERIANLTQQMELLNEMQKDSIARADREERKFQRLRRSMVQSINEFLQRLEDDEFEDDDHR